MILVAAALSGVLVGMVGVGGVLLAPALVVVGGADPRAAALTSLYCLMPCGVVSAWHHYRASETGTLLGLGLAPGVLVGALLGVVLSAVVPVTYRMAGMTLLVAATGLRMMKGGAAPGAPRRDVSALGRRANLVVGTSVGLGSAMTGTSGPVLLVPLLTHLGVVPQQAIAVGQCVQVLVVPTVVLGLSHSVEVPLWTALPLAVATTLGTLGGLLLAKRHPELQKPSGVGVLLLAAAALMVATEVF